MVESFYRSASGDAKAITRCRRFSDPERHYLRPKHFGLDEAQMSPAQARAPVAVDRVADSQSDGGGSIYRGSTDGVITAREAMLSCQILTDRVVARIEAMPVSSEDACNFLGGNRARLQWITGVGKVALC